MAIIKCKMCGGDLELVEGASVATCEYCGTTQTVPTADSEKKMTLFGRANRLLRACEFDKAAGVFESIVAEFPEEAEAYWGLVLCKYGIEYVDDPATGKKIPTCHRSSFDSVLDDDNFEQAAENADTVARKVYREEARAIEELRRGIIEVSGKEAPYDIFICYKETAENGDRTLDSVLAQDIYDALTEKGYRVFFSRVTLEDKLGQEYEPYIFAALNSAKIMLAVGTDYEYYNAVWVKNEWSRFLQLMAAGQKKVLIPCFKGLDPYDMPKEFAKLQSQDLGKVGAMQDLLRGIGKILPKNAPQTQPARETAAAQQPGANTEALLKRAYLFLDEGDFVSAAGYCEKVLDLDPENARAYLGKLLAAQRVRKPEDLAACREPFSGTAEYSRVLRFADPKLKAELEGYDAAIRARNEQARLNGLYGDAAHAMVTARTEADFRAAAAKFRAVSGHRDAAVQAEKCLEKAESARKDAVYDKAAGLLRSAETVRQCQEALQGFESIPGWQDADQLKEVCREKIEQIKAREEAARREKEARQEAARKEREAQEQAARARAARNKRIVITVAALAVLAVAAVLVMTKVVIPGQKYSEAAALLAAGDYEGAVTAFEALGSYKDSAEQINAAHYAQAAALLAEGDYDGAAAAFQTLGDYRDSAEQAIGAIEEKKELKNAAAYADAEALLAAGDYDGAAAAFQALGEYSDSAEQALAAEYSQAGALEESGALAQAAIAFAKLEDYSDARARSLALWRRVTPYRTIDSFSGTTAAVRSDGTVLITGETVGIDVSSWRDIVSVSCGSYHVVGLRADGTVAASGRNKEGQCSVEEWHDITAVSAGTLATRGVDIYGTCGYEDVVDVSLGAYHTVYLKADGTVIASGSNKNGQSDVDGWTGIVAISAGNEFTVGLHADGTVVATGSNRYGECDVDGWTDIVAVSAGYNHTVGLKADGTVVAVGNDSDGECEVSGWTDIAAVAGGLCGTAGLRSDGTVVVAGNNIGDVSSWTDIRLPNV